MQQGCLLSPLLFILGLDILTAQLQRALNSKAVVGVYFPITGKIALHNMYVDDGSAIICVCIQYILEFRRMLNGFGVVSGLKYVWEKTVASFILARPPPPSLWMLHWQWEENTSASKLLGIPIAESMAMASKLLDIQIAESMAMKHLEDLMVLTVDTKIEKFKTCCLSMTARITLAN